MTPLRKKLEAWADDTTYSLTAGGSHRMLDLLWGVIEAADAALDYVPCHEKAFKDLKRALDELEGKLE